MISIPTIFIFSFTLLIVLIWVFTGYRKSIGFLPKLTLSLIALQSVLIGVRWTYDFDDALLLQATLAALIPPLVLLSMRHMASTEAARQPVERLLLFALPSLLVLASPLIEFVYVDWVIEAVAIGFGISLIYMGFSKDIEWRDRVPFEGHMEANLAFIISGVALLISAIVDFAVFYDISRNAGRAAAQIVGLANLGVLLCMSLGVLFINRRGSQDKVQDQTEPVPMSADGLGDPEVERRERVALLKKMDEILIEKSLYRDPDLSLDRLSRKLIIPSRQISIAVNSQRAMNVSQYVNLFRVTEAAYLIRFKNCSITEVIYDVGFNTKSNFNREFKRIVGVSPSEWRKEDIRMDDTPLVKFRSDLLSNRVSWEPAEALSSLV